MSNFVNIYLKALKIVHKNEDITVHDLPYTIREELVITDAQKEKLALLRQNDKNVALDRLKSLQLQIQTKGDK